MERVCWDIAAFFKTLHQTPEQFHPLLRCYRMLSRALIKYLHGRERQPPGALPAAAQPHQRPQKLSLRRADRLCDECQLLFKVMSHGVQPVSGPQFCFLR